MPLPLPVGAREKFRAQFGNDINAQDSFEMELKSPRAKLFIGPDGSIVILPKLPPSALQGFLKHRARPASTDEMDQAIAEGAAETMR